MIFQLLVFNLSQFLSGISNDLNVLSSGMKRWSKFLSTTPDNKDGMSYFSHCLQIVFFLFCFFFAEISP